VGIRHVVLIFGTCFKYEILLLLLLCGGFRYIIDIGGHILLVVQC
jgi:hypothetical protein